MKEKWVARVLVPSSYFNKNTEKTMTPKTKQECDREIESLIAMREHLPDEGRHATDGWRVSVVIGAACIHRTPAIGKDGESQAALLITEKGVTIHEGAQPVLDGIAHDEKGRIKVVGYVNAEELKERIKGLVVFPASPMIAEIIDELAG